MAVYTEANWKTQVTFRKGLHACQTRELTEIYWNEIKLSSKFEPAKELAVKRERELQLSSHSHPRLRPDNLSKTLWLKLIV